VYQHADGKDRARRRHLVLLSKSPHSIILDWLQPGLPNPAWRAEHLQAGRLRRVGARMPGPPLPMTTVVRFEAHSSASALMIRLGTR